MLGRYEYTDETSNKYWTLTLVGSEEYQAIYGRIETAERKGTEMKGPIMDEAKALKTVKSKLQKGYVLVEKFGQGTPLKKQPKKSAKKKAPAKKPAPKVSIDEFVSKCEHFQPSRCTADLPVEFKEYHIAEEKCDGGRYVFYIGCSPINEGDDALISRGLSVTGDLIDKIHNMPQLQTASNLEDFQGTIIDGEVYAGRDKFPEVNSVMLSGHNKALSKQQDDGYLTYVAFDIMFFKGVDVRRRPWHERRKILEHVVSSLDYPEYYLRETEQEQSPMRTLEVYTENFDQVFQQIIEDDGEGLIIKDSRQAYGLGWAKWKKRADVSVIITGFKSGSKGGKYANSLGSFIISAFDEKGNLVEIGHASGMSDEIRNDVWNNKEKYLNQIVDVYAMEMSKANRLRHAVFCRFREDLADIKACTIKKVKEDLKKSKVGKKRF